MRIPLLQQQNVPPDQLDAWLKHLLYYPGDDDETMLSKKVWCSIALTTFILGAILLVVCLVNGFHALTVLTLILCVFFLVNMLLFLWLKRHIQAFFLFSEVFKILYSFAAVVVTGGIMHSGGLVFIGMAGIFFSLIFPDPGKAWPLFLFYLGTLTLETLIQPYLTPMDRFSPGQNLLFFVLTLSAAILSLFIFMRLFIRERARFRKMETEKLLELDRAKSHFFTNISHEFRTPLAVIMGMADHIREDPVRHSSEGVRLIKRNGKKLLRLVNQLMDLSKLESGALPVQYIQADVVLELKYLLASFQSLAESKNIRLYFSSDCTELWMDIDPEKLENTVGNLLDNAIKYTPDGGTVRLRLDLLPPDRETVTYLRITVEDTGIGIPPVYLDHIFDRFFRVGEWPVEGAGVGLAIVREYVKLLKGHIKVTSLAGKGTTFTLLLPVRQQAPKPAGIHAGEKPEYVPEPHRAPPPVSVGAQRPELLIIEDNPDLVRYLDTLLQDQYRLQIARDGDQGIEMALKMVPDIIISDIMMPNKDALEVCRTLKSDIRTNHIPIILLTARSEVASRISGLEAGADAYLAKPFNRRELELELSNLVRLRELLQQKYRLVAGQLPATEAPSQNERFMQEVYKCLETHYQDETFGIKPFYILLGLSRTQLHRKLVALTGMSTSHVIRSYRLEKARTLLQTSRMTVAEVAYAVGFKDPLYFSRAFSHQFGLTPSEAR
ncbi:MAG: response regulator [Saprospirales bacterium]|nr:response regulator [Saprospirales bacterium]